MLTSYFTDPFTLRRLRTEPAGPYLDDFACDLTKRGYCRDRVRAYLRGAGRYSAWAADVALTADTLDSWALAAFGRFLDMQCRLRDSRVCLLRLAVRSKTAGISTAARFSAPVTSCAFYKPGA